MNLTSFAKPQIEVYVNSLRTLEFQHANTEITNQPMRPRLLAGFTMWAAGDVYIGWDWVRSDRDFFALFAPMSIFANATLLTDCGAPISDAASIIELNVVVRRLPWQSVVADQVAQRHKRSRSVPRQMAAA